MVLPDGGSNLNTWITSNNWLKQRKSKSEGFITVISFFPVIIRWYYKTTKCSVQPQAYATKEAMSKYQNFEFKNQKYSIICWSTKTYTNVYPGNSFLWNHFQGINIYIVNGFLWNHLDLYKYITWQRKGPSWQWSYGGFLCNPVYMHKSIYLNNGFICTYLQTFPTVFIFTLTTFSTVTRFTSTCITVSLLTATSPMQARTCCTWIWSTC